MWSAAGDQPASRHWRKGPGQARTDRQFGFRQVHQPVKDIPLYAPPRHKAMIERIYRQHGQLSASAGCWKRPLDEKSQIQTTTDFKEGWSLIDVQHYGADADLQVLAQLHRAWAQGVPAIQLMPVDSPLPHHS
ncbi:MAG: hypothetical protein R3F37_12635 [Candidatus Competibacteraceae bacterium]